MTKPAAAGPISNAQSRLVDCFNASPEFLLFMATSNPAALPMAQRIHTDKILLTPDGTETTIVTQLEAQRPFIGVWRDPDMALTVESRANANVKCGGTICVYGQSWTRDAVERYPTIDVASEDETNAWWNNMVGVMIKETVEAGHDSILPIRRVPSVAVWRNSPERRAHYGDFYAFFCKFVWGLAP